MLGKKRHRYWQESWRHQVRKIRDSVPALPESDWEAGLCQLLWALAGSSRIRHCPQSWGYGHCAQKSLAFAYVSTGYESAGTTFDIRILGELQKATVLSQAVWDPDNERLKS